MSPGGATLYGRVLIEWHSGRFCSAFRRPTTRGKEGQFVLTLSMNSPLIIIIVQCGHLSGKVTVPTGTHISRLIAARFQLDLMQNTMLVIARTDAESARLLSSTVDIRDHQYVRGVTTRTPDGHLKKSLAETLDHAEAAGMSGADIDNLETTWLAENEMLTFDQGTRFAVVSYFDADSLDL